MPIGRNPMISDKRLVVLMWQKIVNSYNFHSLFYYLKRLDDGKSNH